MPLPPHPPDPPDGSLADVSPALLRPLGERICPPLPEWRQFFLDLRQRLEHSAEGAVGVAVELVVPLDGLAVAQEDRRDLAACLRPHQVPGRLPPLFEAQPAEAPVVPADPSRP